MSVKIVYDDGSPVGKAPVPVVPARKALNLKAALPWFVAAGACLVALMAVVLVLQGLGGSPSPDNGSFVAVGRAYLPVLGGEYATAWEDGAKILDAGQPIATALDTVARSWETHRVKAFKDRVTPALSKVVPESKAEKDVTPEERAALAKAWRGLARGLKGE